MKRRSPIHEDECCVYDNHLLTLFISSFYLAALVSSLFASTVTRKYGRKVSMFLGGFCFFIGRSLVQATHGRWVIISRLLLVLVTDSSISYVGTDIHRIF